MHNNIKTHKILQDQFNNLSTNNGYQLFVTNEAIKYIKQLISNNIDMIGLRISIKKSGCAGFSYVFNEVVKDNYNYTDLIFKYDNSAKIFIPRTILPFIDGSKLDYIKDNLGYTLKFHNPKVRHLCGCGESFNI